ncbi:MAG: ABC transporter substrate-binding protein [Faecousia sp.]
MKKLTALLLALSLACGCLTACGTREEEPYVPTGDAILLEGQDPEDFVVEEESPPVTLAYNPEMSMNPLIGYSQNNRVLFSLIYQPLFTVSSNFEAVPILCSAFQVAPSNMIYTCYIEPDARFSDGSQVTAEDVIASYQYAMANDYYQGRFRYYLSEVKLSSDGNGVTFMLNAPYENFPLLLDVPIVKASDVDADHPLGSGPYTFQGEGANATLNRVSNWWADVKIPVHANVINLVTAENDAQVRDEFEFGDVSLVVANPMSDSFADFRCDYELWNVDSGVFLYIGCNVGWSKYFDDGYLRTKLTYAIDRETISERFYNDQAQPASLAISPSSIHYNEALAANYAFDPLKFIDAMSGWNIPKDPTKPNDKMRLLVNSDDSARVRAARYIAQRLTEYGLPTGTLECSGNNYEAVLRANNWDIYLGQTRLPPNMDLSEFFRNWGNLSVGGIVNDNLLKLCKDTLENSGTTYDLLKLLADDGRIIPVLFGYHAVYAERGLFDNLNPTRDNAFYYSMGKTLIGIQIDTVYE